MYGAGPEHYIAITKMNIPRITSFLKFFYSSLQHFSIIEVKMYVVVSEEKMKPMDH